MTKKTIFFDIDGTLVEEGAYISDSTKQALHNLVEKGHQIAICTGRAKYQIPDWILESFPVIVAATGAYVSYNGKVIYEHVVPKEDARLVREAVQKANGILVGQTDRETILSEKNYQDIVEFLKKEVGSEEKIKILLGNAVFTERMEEYGNIRKYFYLCAEKTVEAFAGELGHLFDFTPASFGPRNVGNGEITCKDINKSFGMQKYIEYQGMKAEDTIAFGDGPNDLDMLSFAGIGVAMGNASEELKERADFVTKDIKEDGISYALKKLGLLN